MSIEFPRLEQALARFRSGPALADALRGASDPIPGLLLAVLEEAQGRAPAIDAPRPAQRGTARAIFDDITFIHPRGKQQLAFYPTEFVMTSKRGQIAVPYSAVRSIQILDSLPKDTKNRVVLFLELDPASGITNGKQHMKSVVIQTLSTDSLDAGGSPPVSGVAAVVFCQLFGSLGVAPQSFASPDPSLFQSTSKGAGIEAHIKARSGTLFPMPGGLLFLESPATFIRLADIKGVEFARAGGSSSTFDFIVHLKDDGDDRGYQIIEFSALPQEEVAPLQDYVRAARLKPYTGDESCDEGEERDEIGPSSDDDEDETYDPDARRRSARDCVSSRSRDDGDGGSDAEDEEDDEDEDEEDDDDEDDDDDVELVSEDEFSRDALKRASDEQGHPGSKKARS